MSAKDENGESKVDDSSDSHEDPDSETVDGTDDTEQRPVFTRNIEEATGSVQDQLNEDLDIEEKAQELSERDEEPSRSEIREALTESAHYEVNQNRAMYRGIVHQNISNSVPNWDQNITEVEKANRIDDLIDTTVRVWVDRHIDKLVDLVQDSSSFSVDIKELSEIAVRAVLLQGIIERVTTDTVYHYGSYVKDDVIQWFINNTAVSADQLSEAVQAVMRALLGV